MDHYVSAVKTLFSGPVAHNAATISYDTSIWVEIGAVVALLVVLWLVVFALGYTAEAISWLADALRARRRNAPRS